MNYEGYQKNLNVGLTDAVELLLAYAELFDDSVEQRSPNFPAAMNWNCCRSSIFVNPTLVAAVLTSSSKTQPRRGSTELIGPRARHE
jgi:hypothetical protein